MRFYTAEGMEHYKTAEYAECCKCHHRDEIKGEVDPRSHYCPKCGNATSEYRWLRFFEGGKEVGMLTRSQFTAYLPPPESDNAV